MNRPIGIPLFALALAALSTTAVAQTVGICPVNTVTSRRPACASDSVFRAGECEHGPNWLGHRSHCPVTTCNVCRADERLDSAAGVCIGTTTVRAGTPACESGWRFEGGSCQSGPNWLGHRSHCRLQDCNRCRDDQILDLEHGLCCDQPS